MKYHLRDIKPEMVAMWRQWFKPAADVEISHGDIFGLDQSFDAIVSPANSFGFMDGGIDIIYSQKFGWQLQERLRKVLNDQYDGELPVGQAVVVPIQDGEPVAGEPCCEPLHGFRWLISAPTMRIPSNVAETANAYLAFRAVIRAVKEFNQRQYKSNGWTGLSISSALCPGLGTAVGRMPFDVCAKQMYYAYLTNHLGRPQPVKELADAFGLHHKLIR